jgi:hypothetical protein
MKELSVELSNLVVVSSMIIIRSIAKFEKEDVL